MFDVHIFRQNGLEKNDQLEEGDIFIYLAQSNKQLRPENCSLFFVSERFTLSIGSTPRQVPVANIKFCRVSRTKHVMPSWW